MPIATNDCWIRDYGPTFVEDGPDRTQLGVDWKYNAWGGKYPPWDLDDRLPRRFVGIWGSLSSTGPFAWKVARWNSMVADDC